MDFIKCADCNGIPADVCPRCFKQGEYSHYRVDGTAVVICTHGCMVRLADMPADEPQTEELEWEHCECCDGHGGYCEDADGDVQDMRNPKFPAWE